MKILFIVTLFSTCLISQDVGYKLYKDGDIESALEYYKALIQLDNDDISQEDILYNIGTIYSNMDSTSEAGSIFQQAYHDSLDFSSDLSYNYGNVLYRDEQLDKSLEAYKNTLLKNPNDSDARKNYEFVKNKIKKNKNMEKQQDQNQDSKDNEEDKNDNNNNNSDQNKNQNENEKKRALRLGIKDLNIALGIPVIFGVLTDDTMQQAKNRSGGRHGNKGVEAAITAIKMAVLNQ